MLDAWIIDLLKREELERERLRDEQRPRLELPLYPPESQVRSEEKPPEPERGVWIIDL